MKIYESAMDIIDEQAHLVFVRASYQIETNEAERVAVDHVAKPSTSSRDVSLSNASKLLSLTYHVSFCLFGYDNDHCYYYYNLINFSAPATFSFS